MLFNENLPYTEKAILHYEVRITSDHNYRWHIELHTGKYHQIRAQLSSINCPIIGDNLYGSTATYKPDCIALHASRLEFQHPITNQNIIVEKENAFSIN
jgi:23S rRNA-/tRNA-specific pseudouridylate synthase